MDELRALADEGIVTSGDLNRQRPRLVKTAVRLFGGIVAARDAAGLVSPPRRPRTWTPARVIAELQRLHRQRVRLTSHSLQRAGHHPILHGVYTYFDGLPAARRAAGIPAPAPVIVESITRWDEDAVVATIKERRRAGESLAPRDVPTTLYRAAQTHCGGWRNALELADIDYNSAVRRRLYSDAELLQWLTQMAREHPTWRVVDVVRRGHGSTVVARWGSIEAAVDAAGLRDWPRRRSNPLSRRELLVQIRRLGGVATDAPKAVTYAAERFYGTWLRATDAAGVSRRQSSWSRERIIAELRTRHADGLELHAMALARSVPHLRWMAVHYFGSVNAAIEAAGLKPPARTRPVFALVPMSATAVLATLQRLATKGRPLGQSSIHVPPQLAKNALRHFGTWAAALERAGLDPQDHINKRGRRKIVGSR